MKLISIWILITFSVAAQAIELRFIADQNFETGVHYLDTELGGLSGLTFDESAGALRVISDDRSMVNAARFYSFDVTVTERSFSVKPMGVTTLHAKSGGKFLPMSIDPEGIASASTDHLFITSEGGIRLIPKLYPSLFEFDFAGNLLSQLKIPEKFLPDHSFLKPSKGVRDNKAFEGLTLDMDSGDLIVGTEGPLLQDDSESDFEKGAYVRLLRFKKSSDSGSKTNFNAKQEYVYHLDAIARITDDPKAKCSSGLSELHSMGNGHFLTIERAIVVQSDRRVKTLVRIFDVTIENATDVSGFLSLKKNKFTPVEKHLVIDLNSIESLLTKGFRSIDNIEGITFGPRLQNGNRTLILVSDNNFSDKQSTQFLAFEVLP